jgi:hypothetical protein
MTRNGWEWLTGRLTRRGHMPRSWSQRGFECDLGYAGQGSADGTPGFGRLGVLDESRLVKFGHFSNRDKVDFGDGRYAVNLPQCDRRIGVH